MTWLAEQLEQTRTWTDLEGRVYYVGELTDAALGDALALLNRRASSLAERCRRVEDRDRDVHDDGSVLDWLHDRPLYRRLLAEQRRRARRDAS